MEVRSESESNSADGPASASDGTLFSFIGFLFLVVRRVALGAPSSSPPSASHSSGISCHPSSSPWRRELREVRVSRGFLVGGSKSDGGGGRERVPRGAGGLRPFLRLPGGRPLRQMLPFASGAGSAAARFPLPLRLLGSFLTRGFGGRNAPGRGRWTHKRMPAANKTLDKGAQNKESICLTSHHPVGISLAIPTDRFEPLITVRVSLK